MWDCIHCGVLAIAASLRKCPTCWREREMPKTTSGGSSNAWRAGDGPEAGAEAAPVQVKAKAKASTGGAAEGGAAAQPKRTGRAALRTGGTVQATGTAKTRG